MCAVVVPNVLLAEMASENKSCKNEDVLEIVSKDSEVELCAEDSSSDDEDLIQVDKENSSDSGYEILLPQRYAISGLLVNTFYLFVLVHGQSSSLEIPESGFCSFGHRDFSGRKVSLLIPVT